MVKGVFCGISFSRKIKKDGGFLGGASRKEPVCQCRRHKRHGFDPWVGKIPWRRAWQPTPVFLPGESPWQKSLAGYNPWSHKELIMTEQIGVEMQGWIVILCLSFWGTEEFLRWLLHFTVSAAMYKSSNFSISSLSQELWALQLVIFFWDFL